MKGIAVALGVVVVVGGDVEGNFAEAASSCV